ncbi:MAG: SgcJ/EcaC family oxidoreductase [Gemmatimonadales bacterium]|nr:SgcJ/EcaC family oxidoreductase [Gemmatimonadales bacterium]
MRRLLLGCLLIAACAEAPPEQAQAPDAATLTIQLARQFQQSAAAWNQGDLDAFMADYIQDGTTTYVGSSGLIRGFDGIRAWYAPRFEPGVERDSLRFEDFHVRSIAPSVILVTARYILYRNQETTNSGPFTLVMEQRPDGWKITHDHSSSDAN